MTTKEILITRHAAAIGHWWSGRLQFPHDWRQTAGDVGDGPGEEVIEFALPGGGYAQFLERHGAPVRFRVFSRRPAVWAILETGRPVVRWS